MGKRKRKSKHQQSPLLSSPSFPASSTTVQSEPKPKRRRLALPPQKSIPSSQSQPRRDTSQPDPCPPQVNKKLWNRFYEPLVLLSAYGKSQGKHVKSDKAPSEGHLV